LGRCRCVTECAKDSGHYRAAVLGYKVTLSVHGKTMAAIDVILPVRNGVQFLGEAIDSVQKQTYPDWRLLVLDHGSVDGSLELGQKYAEKDKRIEVFSFPNADGIAALRNLGLARCDCRYLMVQDADDISFPYRMEEMISAFDRDRNLLAIGGDAVLVDPTGVETGYLQVPTDSRSIAAATFFYNPMLHPTITANFPALKKLGAAYGSDIFGAVPASERIAIKRLAEDYILTSQLSLLGRCTNIRLPLIKYRRHGGSVGITSSAEQIDYSLQISRYLAKSFCLVKELEIFDPGPFCNHGDQVFDFGLKDYSEQFAQMSGVLRNGLGTSEALERELEFRWVLATRNSARMASRYIKFQFNRGIVPSERRTIRNWLLRRFRTGKHVYRGANAG
jgi:glycosyltransferase involved in cell wall biosynthesis